MKNLKKLTVVLFATLLSFNFTSCIDDGVSDAVDQVYLAQAQFLLAQAGLKDAEAAYENARAAAELANAAYTDALTANQQAVTAQFIANAALQNAATEAAQAFNAALNALYLAEAQAENEVLMQEYATALAEAQSAHEVAMVALAEAVQDAKDAVLNGLYGQLVTANGELDALMATKLNLQADLALKELLLSAPGNTITWAYAQAALEGTLAGYVADLAAAEANLAAVQAATPSDGQQQLTDLEDQIAALEADANTLEVTLAEAQNAEDAALAQWNIDNAKFADINTKLGEIAFVEDEIQAHVDAIDNLRDIIDVQIPNADQAIIDAETNADAAITTAEGGVTAAIADKNAAFSALDIAQTDLNAKLLVEADALQAWDDAVFYFDDATYGIPLVAYLEFMYSGTQYALENYTPGTPIADLETAVDETNAEEEAATATWIADPAGVTWYDGTLSGDLWENDLIGDHSDTVNETYAEVATWVETAPGSGFWVPDTYTGVIEDLVPTGAVLPAYDSEFTGTAITTLQKDDANGTWWVETEIDDYAVPNWTRMQLARIAAATAQANLDIELEGIQAVIDDRDAALAELELAYLALGYVFPTDVGTADFSDILTVEAYIADREADYNVAAGDVVDATTVRDDAASDLGTDSGEPNAGDSYIDPVNSAWDAVWNAKLALADAIAAKPVAIQDAQDDRDALGVVADLEQDILDIQALMPTHQLALDYLNAELADLMAAFGLDMTLFDMEYFFGYVPSYGAWIDAIKATAAVQAEIDAIDTQIAALENIWDAVYWFISDENVADFLSWQATTVASLNTTIANLELAIEQQEVLIAKGELEADAMAAAIAECERQIEVVNGKITIQEGIIAGLMDRINTYIN